MDEANENPKSSTVVQLVLQGTTDERGLKTCTARQILSMRARQVCLDPVAPLENVFDNQAGKADDVIFIPSLVVSLPGPIVRHMTNF